MENMRKYLSLPGRKYDYCIVTDCKELFKILEILYGKFFSYAPVRKYVELHIYQINKEEYKVSFNGKKWVQKDPIKFVTNTLFESPFFAEEILALHGAAVEANGKAFLFLGSTGVGKTTLTTYLINNGFGYIAEDCILFDFENDVVKPCQLPLHLRDGGAEILRKNHVLLKCQYIDYFSMRRYIYNHPNIEMSSIPIGGIFFIKRSLQNNFVSFVSMEEAFLRLIKSSITQYPLRNPYLLAFKRLSALPCCQLEYSDFLYAKKIIEGKTSVGK